MATKNNKRVTGVNASTIATFEGTFFGIIGLGVAILHSLRSTVDFAESSESLLAGAALGLSVGIISIIILPLVYFAIGWVIGYLHGFVFNVVAEGSGGIEVKLEDA